MALSPAPPFFILGCPRSGTTMLRDLLRAVPGLYCPEETHFYRWCHPFRSPHYQHSYTANQVLSYHRELDGIELEELEALFKRSRTRRDFSDGYLKLFLEKQGAPAGSRWFDKTPQNVYGLTMLAHDYPDSRFIHLYRNPLNVVASLRVGKIISLPDTVAAANVWREAIVNAESFRAYEPDRMLSVSYEELAANPGPTFDEICRFVDIDTPHVESLETLRPEENQFETVLQEHAQRVVREITEPLVAKYQYSFEKF